MGLVQDGQVVRQLRWMTSTELTSSSDVLSCYVHRAGSAIRFAFTGPLLLFTPGSKTLATDFPTVGWSVEETQNTPSTSTSPSSVTKNRRVYTATARAGVSIRLWPPEGRPHDVYPAQQIVDGTPSSDSASSSNGNVTSPSDAAADVYHDSPAVTRTIELTLIDWGSVVQAGSFQVLNGHGIQSPYAPSAPVDKTGPRPIVHRRITSVPAISLAHHTEPLAALPTLLFIGDSLTTGFTYHGSQIHEGGYCGSLEAYPSQFRALLASPVRLYSIAFPGIKLVDDESGEEEGMASKWFRKGPMQYGESALSASQYTDRSASPHTTSSKQMQTDDEEVNTADWNFSERSSPALEPTHIFINIGTNDRVAADDFIQTYESFLSMLKETHGRRTGDIFVLSPFGQRETDGILDSQQALTPRKTAYTTFYPEIEEMVHRLAEKWLDDDKDPLQAGVFPATPVLELAKMHLETKKTLGGNQTGATDEQLLQVTPQSASSAIMSSQTLDAPAAVTTSILSAQRHLRPSLIVRPSSLAAATDQSARGTKARLHYISTEGWLDEEADTFDGLHPTRQGAQKIAARLRDWLAQQGFTTN